MVGGLQKNMELRKFIIKNEELTELRKQANEAVAKANAINVQMSELDVERNKLVFEKDRLVEKMMPLIDKEKDSICPDPFDIIHDIKEVEEGLEFTISNRIEEFKEVYIKQYEERKSKNSSTNLGDTGESTEAHGDEGKAKKDKAK